MTNLPAFFNSPQRSVLAMGLIILVTEILTEVLVTSPYMKGLLPQAALELLDVALLIAIVLLPLYKLILQPMLEQKVEIERQLIDIQKQLDDLRRFQKVTVGRELHMKELLEENAALRNQRAAAQADQTKP